MTRDEVRQYDAEAIARGVPGIVLMENAGRGVADWMMELGAGGPVAILCGKGNNAGDGFVIARQLQGRGCDVHLHLLFDPSVLSGDAAIAWKAVDKLPIPRTLFDGDEKALTASLAKCQWIVDAMLGTGMTGEVREPFRSAIRAVNASAGRGVRVMAVDLPSGLDCDTGIPSDPTVKAKFTCTFVAAKVGFANPLAANHLGEVRVADIGAGRV
jgi:NAD(P)H-hydrate epimerase